MLCNVEMMFKTLHSHFIMYALLQFCLFPAVLFLVIGKVRLNVFRQLNIIYVTRISAFYFITLYLQIVNYSLCDDVAVQLRLYFQCTLFKHHVKIFKRRNYIIRLGYWSEDRHTLTNYLSILKTENSVDVKSYTIYSYTLCYDNAVTSVNSQHD